jgi:hypothetical protein
MPRHHEVQNNAPADRSYRPGDGFARRPRGQAFAGADIRGGRWSAMTLAPDNPGVPRTDGDAGIVQAIVVGCSCPRAALSHYSRLNR